MGWWSQEKITATINQSYVEKELGLKKYQDILHRVLAFGDGLTDDTYLDWILERSPRFFLILNDIGVPEKIFEVIDRSFDDDDLPLTQDALWELNLFGTTSETLDRKFYRQQFHFLIQELEPGGHVDYGSWNVVPVETTVKKASIPAAVASTDRVFTQERLYTRKKIPTSGGNSIDRIRFIMHLKNIAAIQHQHLVTVWATYSQENHNYVLLTPPCDITLKHVLDDKDIARHFKALEKHERRHTLLTWMHCLTSGLAYLHSRGFMHKSIRPSTISIDHQNRIYLDGYNALRVLDVDDAPNPYNGEIYEHAPPENWQRKPTLHETAPLKTVLPGGGRTMRRIPKTHAGGAESRRPSVTGHDYDRPHSRSQESSSGSSTNLRPRNAVITTFAPPDTTPASVPSKYFPGDIYSLTTVILTMLSCLLGHSPRTFASHRSKVNRQAGRGNAPPDASFHKNPKQVEKWIQALAKEAGQKEKKDQKLWGAVVELVNLCRQGLIRDPDYRIVADELEKQTLGWVDWGIGRRRKCDCCEEDRSFDEPQQPNAVLTAQRGSIHSWSKISERISSGLYSDESQHEPTVRPRRSLSKRLTLDRNPELRRSRLDRPPSSMSGTYSSLAPTEDQPASPTTISRRQTDIIRSAVKHAVQPMSTQHLRKLSNNNKDPSVVRQGRSTYRLKPKIPISAGRRNTHPMHPSPPPIQEEPSVDDETDSVCPPPLDESSPGPSSYTLKPRRRTHPMTRPIPQAPPPPPKDSSVPPTPSSIQPPTPKWENNTDVPSPTIIYGIPVLDEDEEIGTNFFPNPNQLVNDPDADADAASAAAAATATSLSYITSSRPPSLPFPLPKHDSFAGSEVWGLGNALDEEGEVEGVEGEQQQQQQPHTFSAVKKNNSVVVARSRALAKAKVMAATAAVSSEKLKHKEKEGMLPMPMQMQMPMPMATDMDMEMQMLDLNGSAGLVANMGRKRAAVAAVAAAANQRAGGLDWPLPPVG